MREGGKVPETKLWWSMSRLIKLRSTGQTFKVSMVFKELKNKTKKNM